MQCNRFKTEIFFTLPICGLMFALACTSLISEQWVVGHAVSTSNAADYVDYNFGLFRGFKYVIQAGATEEQFSLGVVCQESVGKCMYSCFTAEPKKVDLEDILSPCPILQNFADIYCVESQPWTPGCNYTYRYDSEEIAEEKKMLNYGPYVATIVFVVFGLIMTLVAAGFGAYNAFSSPIEMIVGVHGLFIWHGSAALFYFLGLVIWAGEYEAHLKKNPPISDILRKSASGDFVVDSSDLGYSFWLVFVCFILHLSCIGLVVYYIRTKYKPKRVVVDIPSERGPDKNIMLY